MTVRYLVLLTEFCLDDPKDIDLEQLLATPKETSLGDSSVERMAMQKALMTVNDWAKQMEIDSEQLMEIPKEMSLACLMVERMVMRMVQMTEIGLVQL